MLSMPLVHCLGLSLVWQRSPSFALAWLDSSRFALAWRAFLGIDVAVAGFRRIDVAVAAFHGFDVGVAAFPGFCVAVAGNATPTSIKGQKTTATSIPRKSGHTNVDLRERHHSNANPAESGPRQRQSRGKRAHERRSWGTSHRVGRIASPAARLSVPSWCCTDQSWSNYSCGPTVSGLNRFLRKGIRSNAKRSKRHASPEPGTYHEPST